MRFLIIFFLLVFCVSSCCTQKGDPPLVPVISCCLLRKRQEMVGGEKRKKKKSISSGCLSRFAGSWGLHGITPSSLLSFFLSLLHPLILERLTCHQHQLTPVGGKITSELSFSCVISLIAYSATASIGYIRFFFSIGWLCYLFCSPEEERKRKDKG